jgi:hypothetical protein
VSGVNETQFHLPDTFFIVLLLMTDSHKESAESAESTSAAADNVLIGPESLIPDKSDDPKQLQNALKQLRIRIGTLLKTENVAFLIGAGC